MPRTASSTGLIAARTRPVRRPKPKKIELLGNSVPAPFTLRPFAGLYNPYSYGCSVLCNHPADGDAKAVVRRAKDTWASEGKAVLLSAAEIGQQQQQLDQDADCNEDELRELREQLLFRRYNGEIDSRSPSPAARSRDSLQVGVVCREELLALEQTTTTTTTAHRDTMIKERATLVLDLRASAHAMQDETLSWHALTLEPIPSSRRSDLSVSSSRTSYRKAPIFSRKARVSTAASSPPVRSIPIVEVSDAASTRSAPTNLCGRRQDDDYDDEDDSSPAEEASGTGAGSPMRRRGKLRRKKRKCRRGSIYGQQTEVRELPEPLETQVSQCDDGSRRGSSSSKLEESKQPSIDKTTLPIIKKDLPSSFLPPEVIKDLSRGLDRETIESEFNANRRYALEEVMRVTGGEISRPSGLPAVPKQMPILQNTQNVPRLFYRQSSKFELLDSQSLIGLKPLDYLSRHVHITDARRLTYGRAFNVHKDETLTGPRYVLTSVLAEALQDVLGREITASEQEFLEKTLLEVDTERLEFRTWCGLCAFAERALPQLAPRGLDPPAWLERADFEMLERRIAGIQVDERLVKILRLIRDR